MANSKQEEKTWSEVFQCKAKIYCFEHQSYEIDQNAAKER